MKNKGRKKKGFPDQISSILGRFWAHFGVKRGQKAVPERDRFLGWKMVTKKSIKNRKQKRSRELWQPLTGAIGYPFCLWGVGGKQQNFIIQDICPGSHNANGPKAQRICFVSFHKQHIFYVCLFRFTNYFICFFVSFHFNEFSSTKIGESFLSLMDFSKILFWQPKEAALLSLGTLLTPGI